MSKPNEYLREFIISYLEAALWSECDDDGCAIDNNYGIGDINPKSKRAAIRDCIIFVEANATDLQATGAKWGRHGFDYWLTRNGHGAGFWDRGYGKRGERLTAAAKADGSRCVIVNAPEVYIE